MDEYNLKIIKYLALGMMQKDISMKFKKKGIKPNSVSIIEKNIKKIKKENKAKTLFHLAIILKGKKII